MKVILEIKNVTKEYEKNILNHVNLSVHEGDYMSIVGASGSGKSTLLNILGGLDLKYEGKLIYRGKALDGKKEVDLYRNKNVGFVFQSFNLLPKFTARENVLLPYIYSVKEVNRIEERMQELFKYFGIQKNMNQDISKLSGGEKQRVALIRSIILNPSIILADEPTGNLDSENGNIVQEFFKELHKIGKTVVVVTHDNKFAESATRQVQLINGKIYEK